MSLKATFAIETVILGIILPFIFFSIFPRELSTTLFIVTSVLALEIPFVILALLSNLLAQTVFPSNLDLLKINLIFLPLAIILVPLLSPLLEFFLRTVTLVLGLILDCSFFNRCGLW